MQNSAITFSFCIDYNEAIFESFIDELHDEYEVLYNKNVRLLRFAITMKTSSNS